MKNCDHGNLNNIQVGFCSIKLKIICQYGSRKSKGH